MTDILDELERLHAAAPQVTKEARAMLREWCVANGQATLAFVIDDLGRAEVALNHLSALLATLREMREALAFYAFNGNRAEQALIAARERLGAK